MEFYDGNTLARNLYSRPDPRFPEEQIRFHLAEIICGLFFLHRIFVVHGYVNEI